MLRPADRPIRIYFITDIPTPYRNHGYGLMARIFPEYGLDFHVFYMAVTKPDRHWTFEKDDFQYQHRFFWGIHPRIMHMVPHLNPGLIRHIRKEPADITVVCGYATPSHWLSTLLCPKKSRLLLSAESNLSSITFTNSAARRFKSFLLRKHEGFIITGNPTRELIETLCPEARDRSFITFPNLIDKSVFIQEADHRKPHRAEIRKELGIEPSSQMWFCPIRLEPFKGLHLFLPLMEKLKNVVLCVAGTGSRQDAWLALADEHRVDVRFLGQQNQQQMIDLYVASDLFVLPSLKDPSPLSPIEACAVGRPILVSDKIGNLEDVLIPDENGWVYRPDDPEANRPILEHIASLSPEKLDAIGQSSRRVYNSRFDSETCIRRFAQALRALVDE